VIIICKIPFSYLEKDYPLSLISFYMEKILKSVEWIVLAKLSSHLLSIILTYILGQPSMLDVGFIRL